MIIETPVVVVVDDNSTVLALFERAADNLAIELHTFSSVTDANVFLAETKPKLLFLDIIMPEKDGLAYLQELRRQTLHRDTPVIMITSKDYAQDRTLANELYALEFITKPMPMQEIRDIILKYVNER